jgi:hypothetical protein
MSTVTAVGPALDIDGPLPSPPPHRLLSIPGVLQEGPGRWQNGVNVYGYPEETPGLWEPCSSGTFRVKDEGGGVSQPRFDPVGLYIPITCSTLGMGDWRDFAGRAEAVLDATQSFGVEEALSQGVSGSTNPFLGDANVSVLGGGAVTPIVGLSWLEDAVGATGRAGLIHATPSVVASWSDLLLVEGGTLYTYNGTPVAVGGGYIGAEANGSAAGAGQSYAFATGPVEVMLSDVSLVGDDINGSLDTSANEVTFRAERFALAEWDTALQAAVLIDWTP